MPVLRSLVSRADSQQWTFQGSPGVLTRCARAARYSKVLLMSAESQPVRQSCAVFVSAAALQHCYDL